jgi:hypothetical protein
MRSIALPALETGLPAAALSERDIRSQTLPEVDLDAPDTAFELEDGVDEEPEVLPAVEREAPETLLARSMALLAAASTGEVLAFGFELEVGAVEVGLPRYLSPADLLPEPSSFRLVL